VARLPFAHALRILKGSLSAIIGTRLGHAADGVSPGSKEAALVCGGGNGLAALPTTDDRRMLPTSADWVGRSQNHFKCGTRRNASVMITTYGMKITMQYPMMSRKLSLATPRRGIAQNG
jgi:hypothetical protein